MKRPSNLINVDNIFSFLFLLFDQRGSINDDTFERSECTLIVVYGVSLLFPKNITKEKNLIDILLEEIAPLSSKRVACNTTLSIHSLSH